MALVSDFTIITEPLQKTGKFFRINFVKLDGSERTMVARFGVKKYLKGGKSTNGTNLVVYELGQGYKAIRPDSITSIKVDGVTFKMLL